MTTYHDHPEYQHLLAAVRAAPDDDLPRLVLADWLEENGESERAEFVRAQCELASPYDVHADVYWRGQLDTPPDVARRVQLRSRSAELLALHGHKWGGKGVIHTPLGTAPCFHNEDGSDPRPTCEWSRGFIDRVSGPLAVLVGGECGRCGGGGRVTAPNPQFTRECQTCGGTGRTPGVLRDLVRREPVRVVEVTDREPADRTMVNGCWYWFRNGRNALDGWHDENHLPDAVFDRLGGAKPDTIGLPYPTAAAARADLSEAILRWAEQPES